MPKFSCCCGEVINLSETPSRSEYALTSENRIEEIARSLSGKDLTQERFYDLIDESKTVVYVCFRCGRMHLESRIHSNEFGIYVLESTSKKNECEQGESDDSKFRAEYF